MPASWLERLAPAAADVWARCLLPLHEQGPSWATLSLDPTATRVEVLRGVAYLLVFLAAIRIAARREGVTFLEGGSDRNRLGALALAAWLHPPLGAEKVFGFYQPMRSPGARHLAPILNVNALSGYLNIALCLIFAQALRPSRHFRAPSPSRSLPSSSPPSSGLRLEEGRSGWRADWQPSWRLASAAGAREYPVPGPWCWSLSSWSASAWWFSRPRRWPGRSSPPPRRRSSR